jgi:hypothetical protein
VVSATAGYQYDGTTLARSICLSATGIKPRERAVLRGLAWLGWAAASRLLSRGRQRERGGGRPE